MTSPRTPSRIASLCSAGLALALTFAPSAARSQTPEVSLSRIECGTTNPANDIGRFSDTFAYEGRKLAFVFSCYLVRHGKDLLLWDTGHAMTAGAVAPKVSIVDQLAQGQIRPDQIGHVGISHYHADHTGQVASFPQATLLIGRGDWDAISAPRPTVPAAPFAHWLTGGGKVEALPADKDVYGDGTVMLLMTPGHTPGHHSLLVRLRETGPVLITGDLAHFHENYDGNGVPSFNTSRAETLSSLDRFKKIAAQTQATVVIQHDARDVGKLPAFPAAAR